MSAIKIHEQIAFLRKRENMTQEELAQVLGVTNQSVSKWESGACCPDIALLPEIASYFKVSVDELLGYKAPDSMNDVYLKIKNLFQATPAEDCFELALKLGFVLHEGAFTGGYKAHSSWDTTKVRTGDDFDWGFSARNESEGITVMKGKTVIIASCKNAKPISARELQDIYHFIKRLEDYNTLRVLFCLYDLTQRNGPASLAQIAAACFLSEEHVLSALDKLPYQMEYLEDNSVGYLLEGSYMHIPTILSMLVT